MELELINREDKIVCEMTVFTSVPHSLVLMESVKVSYYCRSVASYKGFTYVGLGNSTIDRIDSDYQLTKAFMSGLGGNGNVYGMTVYKDLIYALVSGTPYVVKVHDLSGNFVREWNHIDISGINLLSNNLVTLSDRIIIPDRSNSRLTVYTLTGEVIKHISCTLKEGHIALCTVGSDSVIVSDCESCQVSRIDVTTDEVIWSSKVIYKPRGVTSYGQDYILVSRNNSDMTNILSAKTGG